MLNSIRLSTEVAASGSMRSPRLALALCTVLASGGLASATLSASVDDNDASNLLKVLEHQTELATKTGMNADYIPGMVTILSGEDMLARGSRTVWESLSLVPGISQGLEVTGERQLLSRGVGHGYASGNIKILLDGVSMNTTLTARANAVLNMPIEQVERIEVIRGPGSSVYGEYAYAGVINVISRQRDRTLHLQAGEDAGAGGGGVWYWQDPDLGLTSSINFIGIEGNGGVEVDEDALFAIGRPELSNAPGRSNEATRFGSVIANVQWRDLFASFSVLDDAYGDHFGINHFLPPSDDHLATHQRYVTGQIGSDWRISKALDGRIRFEVQQQDRDRENLYVFPAGYFSERAITMDQDYRETSYFGAADVHWRPAPRHEVLLGLEAKQIQVDEASWTFRNFFHPLPPTWLDTTTQRRILSAIVQDAFRLSDALTLTATLRYDDYDDVGAYASPRAAAVWRIDDQNILKFQFAQAFRPPTFYELAYAGGYSIDVSEITTWELGYILRRPLWEARFVAVHSDLSNPIVFDELGIGAYTNGSDIELNGVELEYVHRFGSHVKLDANLSYVDAKRQGSGEDLPGGTPLLGNVALLWQASDRIGAALQLRYVGERNREAWDQRAALGDYTLLDLTLNWGSRLRGLNGHIGVKNLTNADVRYPDQFTSFDGVELPYSQDYPRPGRRWWLSIGYNF